jgi:hypothetical protein
LNSHLTAFLNRIGSNFTENWYKIRDIQNWMLDEINRKRIQYPYWKKKVLFSWVSWKNKKDKDVFNFYMNKFNELFLYFFEKMFPFDFNRLELLKQEYNQVNNSEIFFEYRYLLKERELEEFIQFKKEFNHPDHHYRIISYVYNLIIMVFGKLMKDILKNNFQITMLCAEIRQVEDKVYLYFLIVSRTTDIQFLKVYLRTIIFHFAEILPSINPKFLDHLRNQKNQIYPIAIQDYSKSQENLSKVLFTLKRKAQVLDHCTPFLDILNFICSRVEDSIFDTDVLVKDIINTKITKNPSESKFLYKMFNFLNSKASLFSTFQSNNKANIERQYKLFFAYVLHFCSDGLEMMPKVGKFFFDDVLEKKISKIMVSDKYKEINYETFFNFLLQGLVLPSNKGLGIVFSKIFQNTVYELNESFFESFLFSLNQKLHELIIEEQKKLKLIREDDNGESILRYEFNDLMQVVSVILNGLVNKVFIRDSLQDANKNFRDRLTRYTPEKIALRLLELKIFKDIPLSDNNWQDYYLSRNKDYIKKVFRKYYDIPDSYFFTPERLLKINMIYERGILDSSPQLEKWVVDKIIRLFYNFQEKINSQLSPNTNRTELTKIITDYFSQGVIDVDAREQLEDISDFFASIWVL